ncbi:MAG: AMP-binding protein [Arcobacteraceae bacterium]|nr:AMP-binding protein [Arcobacteraceae bacterium]
MNIEFLNSIRENNTTKEGMKFLYETLSLQEQKCWDETTQQNITNFGELFSLKAKQTPKQIVINEVDTNNSYTYEELELSSNKIKNFLLNTTQEYQIGINYHNSFEFLATVIGINKAGKLAILFNNREPENRLEELAQTSNTKIVFGNSIKGLQNYNILEILQGSLSKISNPKFKTQLDDPAFVIFTSGTSGPSKGALFSHRRAIGAGIAWSLRTGMTSSDNCYIPLPLYHGNALAVAFSSVIFANATATLRIKFSTTHFFEDINSYKCNYMVYIGELWRYILKRYDTNPNKYLKVIFGNGLTKNLWNKVVEQFNITHVVEHFGSTEMPAGALTNWFDKEGYCGYLPADDPRLNEMVLVDENYKVVSYGKNGQALFKVPSGVYKGYLDSSLDETKLHRNFFETGDAWWKSGDLLSSSEDGFYTFIERLGDTYRFKGENVACVDVEEKIDECGEFDEVVVYGVSLPNIDGKIGMASLVTKEKLNLDIFLKKLQEKLPSYALPYILKFSQQKHITTTTLKIQKTALAKEGIENYKKAKHFVLINGKYIELNQILYNKIKNCEIILGK